jgi:hypothetical protein
MLGGWILVSSLGARLYRTRPDCPKSNWFSSRTREWLGHSNLLYHLCLVYNGIRCAVENLAIHTNALIWRIWRIWWWRANPPSIQLKHILEKKILFDCRCHRSLQRAYVYKQLEYWSESVIRGPLAIEDAGWRGTGRTGGRTDVFLDGIQNLEKQLSQHNIYGISIFRNV